MPNVYSASVYSPECAKSTELKTTLLTYFDEESSQWCYACIGSGVKLVHVYGSKPVHSYGYFHQCV